MLLILVIKKYSLHSKLLVVLVFLDARFCYAPRYILYQIHCKIYISRKDKRLVAWDGENSYQNLVVQINSNSSGTTTINKTLTN